MIEKFVDPYNQKDLDAVEFESGLITAHRLYFQELSIMTRMGLMPSAGAVPA